MIKDQLSEDIKQEKLLLEQKLEFLKERHLNGLLEKAKAELVIVGEINQLLSDERYKRICQNSKYNKEIKKIEKLYLDKNRFEVSKSIDELNELLNRIENLINTQQLIDEANIEWIKNTVGKDIFDQLESRLTHSSFLSYIDKDI